MFHKLFFSHPRLLLSTFYCNSLPVAVFLWLKVIRMCIKTRLKVDIPATQGCPHRPMTAACHCQVKAAKYPTQTWLIQRRTNYSAVEKVCEKSSTSYNCPLTQFNFYLYVWMLAGRCLTIHRHANMYNANTMMQNRWAHHVVFNLLAC